MISLELKNAYNNLDLNNKRNKLGNELLITANLLKQIENMYGLVPNFTIKNYESSLNLNEEEFLSLLYENVFEIEKQLILLTDRINTNQTSK